MSRRKPLFLLVAALLAGCGGDDGGRRSGENSSSAAIAASTSEQTRAAAATNTLIDAAGVVHVFEQPARRIVSLVPSATATLRAIGADVHLVGRTDFDTDAWVAAVPSVGGGLDPNLETLLALQPDLVIRFEGEQDPRTPARLDEFGIRHVGVRPVSLEDIYLTNEIVGVATGLPSRADSLSTAIRTGLQQLAESVAALPRLDIAYVLGGSPPWVAGPDTYITDVVSIAGGDNVFVDLGRPYASISPEELRTRKIDVVLVSSEGAFDENLVPGARIVVIGEALEMPGPDVVEAAWRVAELLHGRSLR